MRKFKLTLKKVRAAARAALADGTLAALHSEETKRECQYRYPGLPYKCAIGAALSDELALRLEQTHGVSSYKNAALLNMGEEENMIRNIQNVHDQWLQYGHPEDEAHFRRLINMPKTVKAGVK